MAQALHNAVPRRPGSAGDVRDAARISVRQCHRTQTRVVGPKGTVDVSVGCRVCSASGRSNDRLHRRMAAATDVDRGSVLEGRGAGEKEVLTSGATSPSLEVAGRPCTSVSECESLTSGRPVERAYLVTTRARGREPRRSDSAVSRLGSLGGERSRPSEG